METFRTLLIYPFGMIFLSLTHFAYITSMNSADHYELTNDEQELF